MRVVVCLACAVCASSAWSPLQWAPMRPAQIPSSALGHWPRLAGSLSPCRLPQAPVMVCREWRVFGVEVPVTAAEQVAVSYNEGLTVSAPVLEALAKRLGMEPEQLRQEDVELVSRSLDARPERKGGREHRASDSTSRPYISPPRLTERPSRCTHTRAADISLCAGRGRATGAREVRWSYVVDVKLAAAAAKRLKAQPGRLVPAAQERVPSAPPAVSAMPPPRRHVVVVGAGPCGLFAALTLARAGHRVTLCERGKPVEERGK